MSDIGHIYLSPMSPRHVSFMSFIEEEVCGKDIHISKCISFRGRQDVCDLCLQDMCLLWHIYLFHRPKGRLRKRRIEHMCSTTHMSFSQTYVSCVSKTCVFYVFHRRRSLWKRYTYIYMYIFSTDFYDLFHRLLWIYIYLCVQDLCLPRHICEKEHVLLWNRQMCHRKHVSFSQTNVFFLPDVCALWHRKKEKKKKRTHPTI